MSTVRWLAGRRVERVACVDCQQPTRPDRCGGRSRCTACIAAIWQTVAAETRPYNAAA